MKLLCYAICCYLVSYMHLFAQPTTLVEKYPHAKAICTQKSKTLSLTYQHDRLQCKATYYTEVLHLSTQSSSYANESVNFSQFHEITSLKAYTLLPNKKKIYVKDFVTRSVLGSNIFFDDLKEKSFTFPAISSGAKTVVEYEELIKEPRLLGRYYFNSYLPVEKSEFTVKVSHEVKVAYKLFGENQAKIQFKTYKTPHETIYQWTAENLAPLKNEENTARQSQDEPHLVVYIEEVKSKLPTSLPTYYLKNLSYLYEWYYELSKAILTEENTYIKNLADSLTQSCKTDREKATVLYTWVQQYIRYIAFEDGLGGLVPRKPEDVCKKRYGDCKDMATLLYMLAKAVKIPAYLVWVGTRTIPYRYDELPVPIVDNHLITAFCLDNHYVFADATADYLPFGMPSEFIQGKQGLLGIGYKQFELVQIPMLDAEKNLYYDSLSLKIDSNKVQGTGKVYLVGYPITKAKTMYYAVNPTSKKNILDKKNAALTVSLPTLLDTSVSHYLNYTIQQENVAVPSQFSVSYTCSSTSFVKSSGTDIFINLHIDKKLATEKIDTTRRETAISIDFPSITIQEVTLEIPPHWHINFTPPNRTFEHEKFSFHVSYRNVGTKIILRKEITLRSLTLQKSDFLAWNTMLEELTKTYQETVSFYE